MATKPRSVDRRESGLTRPGDLYVQGDALPLPEVSERNTDSVWALWSDLVDETEKPAQQQDFIETVPIRRDNEEPTALMPLPDLPQDKDG